MSLTNYGCECIVGVSPVVQCGTEGDMRLLLFASILLVALSAVGQNQSTRSGAQGGQTSKVDDQATSYPQTNSGCFAIETFRFDSVEQPQPDHPVWRGGSVRHSTCTDSSLFRVRNVPNLTLRPHL